MSGAFGQGRSPARLPGHSPKADLDEAETLIDACGYRRDQELADARAVLG